MSAEIITQHTECKLSYFETEKPLVEKQVLDLCPFPPRRQQINHSHNSVNT